TIGQVHQPERVSVRFFLKLRQPPQSTGQLPASSHEVFPFFCPQFSCRASMSHCASRFDDGGQARVWHMILRTRSPRSVIQRRSSTSGPIMICISVTPESRQLAKVDIYNAANQCDLVELCLDRLH